MNGFSSSMRLAPFEGRLGAFAAEMLRPFPCDPTDRPANLARADWATSLINVRSDLFSLIPTVIAMLGYVEWQVWGWSIQAQLILQRWGFCAS